MITLKPRKKPRLLPPTVISGAYPERLEGTESRVDRFFSALARSRHRSRSRRGLARFARDVNAAGADLTGKSREELSVVARELRAAFANDGFRPQLVVRCFALVRAVSELVLGQRHYDSQIIGGRVLLDGMVAEMETGEGKTLTATLPASTAALAGVPVHVVTVNDYLAKRDAKWMQPIYETLGLSVGTIVHGLAQEVRQLEYASDITYCTNKELAFDYLRDRITLRDDPSHVHLALEGLRPGRVRQRRLVLRGLHFAIVDEADSVLVDEARTPLIISSQIGGDDERRVYETALELADSLNEGKHFKIDRADRNVTITSAGGGRLAEMCQRLPGLWKRRKKREELVNHALQARHVLVRDRHYLLKDDAVQIIDEYTGRTMPDRSWEHGLHQAVEAKEGCAITKQNRPVARISYQRFFRRYRMLAGMTGTVREVAGEIGSVYGISWVRVPTNRPLIRKGLGVRYLATADEKWTAIAERVAALHREGRPVLVGSRSVEASEILSAKFAELDLPHRVLNARQDQEEAEIIAHAGERGRITVATNMAGRGTDIRLGEGVAELGGLHVIATELHESRRIDRQLFGRCGRQGDPGSFEAVVSLEDELIEQYLTGVSKRLAARARGRERISQRLGAFLFRRAQAAAQKKHSRLRKDLLRMDDYLERALAFSGRGE